MESVTGYQYDITEWVPVSIVSQIGYQYVPVRVPLSMVSVRGYQYITNE